MTKVANPKDIGQLIRHRRKEAWANVERRSRHACQNRLMVPQSHSPSQEVPNHTTRSE